MTKKRSVLIALALTMIILLSLCAGCGQQTKAEKSAKIQEPSTGEAAADAQKMSSLKDLTGRKVGVLTGDANEQNVRNLIPGCEIEFFNSVSDLAVALVSGKIDAFADDESTERFILKQYPEFDYLDKLCDCYYASVFPKNEAGRALCGQMSEYLTEIHTNGVMAEIDAVWFGDDEAAKTVDLSGLTGENGTLSMAISTSVGYPFAYVKDGSYVGYDIDIAVRFCRAYGYDIRFYDYDFSGFLAAVAAGKCDFGASGVTVSEERKESVLFSEPNYYSASVIVALKENIEKSAAEVYASTAAVDKDSFAERFAGKRIGLVTGSIFDLLAAEYLPESIVEYINSSTDLALALEAGRIDAYIADEPTVRVIQQTYEEQYICAAFETITYGYAFPKGSEKSDRIRTQLDEFITRLRTDGTLEEIDAVWFGSDESKKVVDFQGLTGENGEISYAISTDVGAPFSYMKYDQYTGYDVDILARFCREYGYSLKISDYALGGLLAGIAGGKCDLGSCGLGITEERKESMNFSVPNYEGSIVLVTKEREETDVSTVTDTEQYQQLRGARVGVVTGMICDVIAQELIPECQVQPMNTNADLALALETGKVDAYVTDQPIARVMLEQYPNHHVFGVASQENYAYIFPKNSRRSDLLCAQMNRFLEKLQEEKTLREIDDIWFGDDEAKQTVDYSGLTAVNGELTMAISSGVGAPFCYVKDDRYVGYDVDIAVRFCREYGYGIRFEDSNFGGMIAAVSGGKCDFGASCVTVTEERKESLLFSDPNYHGGTVVVTKGSFEGQQESGSQFLQSVRESFQKTFLRENRWQLFLNGIGITLIITLISAVCGTAIAFLVYLVYRKNFFLPNLLVNLLSDILQKTPVVVILMILYYLVFGKASLDGVWVSCIGFSLIFSCSVLGALRVAVGAVDAGQMEAAQALGYTDTRAFLRMILPQAMQHFLPVYQGEIVTLIKATAIVGYIAVQDLTKVSDIVRSRTYEAFFPLIASAVIYFAAAWILTLLVRRLRIKSDPKRRTGKKFLKGVRTK